MPGTHEGEWCLDRSVRNERASMRFRQHRSTRRAQARLLAPASDLPSSRGGRRACWRACCWSLSGQGHPRRAARGRARVGPASCRRSTSAPRAAVLVKKSSTRCARKNEATLQNMRVAQSRKKQPPQAMSRHGDEPHTRLPCGGCIFRNGGLIFVPPPQTPLSAFSRARRDSGGGLTSSAAFCAGRCFASDESTRRP